MCWLWVWQVKNKMNMHININYYLIIRYNQKKKLPSILILQSRLCFSWCVFPLGPTNWKRLYLCGSDSVANCCSIFVERFTNMRNNLDRNPFIGINTLVQVNFMLNPATRPTCHTSWEKIWILTWFFCQRRKGRKKERATKMVADK